MLSICQILNQIYSGSFDFKSYPVKSPLSFFLLKFKKQKKLSSEIPPSFFC